MKRALLIALLLAAPLYAQDPPEPLLLRNVSGTVANPGAEVPHVILGDGSSAWTLFSSASAHLTYVSETGPEDQRNEIFSTNWIIGGVQREIGDRGILLLRGRVSLEPFTMPEDAGYPQLLQFVSVNTGGDFQLDRMRPHDLLGEAAAQFAYRLGGESYLHVYAAAVGDPALGAAPFALRSSAMEFAEAPFGYDIQEASHDSTQVITAGFSSRFVNLEASVFHDHASFGDHTDIELDGEIDSQSARLTLMPTRNLSIQVSRGELGEEDLLFQRTVSSASISYGNRNIALTGLWTRREIESVGFAEEAMGIEATIRAGRNTFMARAESVDRPLGFPFVTSLSEVEDTGHFSVGYLFDFISRGNWRTGAGLNVDYHTRTREFEDVYGHKPQSIYAFVRVRVGG